jgi:diguanylate cyclase (GGDEF)-like protein/PAS domain S-box-containing protein
MRQMELRRARRNEREARDRFVNFSQTTSDAIVCANGLEEVTFWNPAAEKLFGHPSQDALGKPIQSVIPFNLPTASEAVAGQMFDRHCGDDISVELSVARWDENGQPCLGVVARDVSARREAEEGLIASEHRFELLVSSITDYAVYMLDPDGVVSNWNPGAQRFKGYASEEIIGKNFECFYTKEDRDAGRPKRALEISRNEGHYEEEGLRVRKDGSCFWANVVIDPIRNDAGTLIGYAKITRDVTDKRLHEQHLNYLAHYDTLTGLANRFNFRKKLDEAVEAGSPITVLMLDLDDFTDVNDTLGHAAGDTILNEAADRIQHCQGEGATIGRIGGDEFAVILTKLADPIVASKKCEHLKDAFNVPFSVEGQDINLGLSIGIAIAPNHGNSAEELLSNADLALYRAKAGGHNRHCLFEPIMRHTALAQRKCQQELRRAVADGELELFYQPQIYLPERRIVGAEALLRWRHPERGLLSPNAFLSVLERGSLVHKVGKWIIHTACEHAATVRRLGLENFYVGVNLFGAQFRDDDLLSTVVEALRIHDLPPDAIELEITENVILKHDEKMLPALQELRQLGISIAFDDYGTGYASLSQLKRYPLTRLKIDQSFIRNLCSNAGDVAVVGAILHLAEVFELDVVAEGIEDEMQDEALRKLGCTLGQGYFYARPMPAGQFIETIKGQTRKSQDGGGLVAGMNFT